MRQTLILHPDCTSPSVQAIDVEVAHVEPNNLALVYRITGDIDGLALPPVESPSKGRKLWEHTCFEAFLRADGDPGYYELNVAPSRRWAAYRFEYYRALKRRFAREMGAPRIAWPEIGENYVLHIVVRTPQEARWRLGLSAVIEEKSGNKSYWALAHPPGEPDFHHPTCFALELPAAGGP